MAVDPLRVWRSGIAGGTHPELQEYRYRSASIVESRILERYTPGAEQLCSALAISFPENLHDK